MFLMHFFAHMYNNKVFTINEEGLDMSVVKPIFLLVITLYNSSTSSPRLVYLSESMVLKVLFVETLL